VKSALHMVPSCGRLLLRRLPRTILYHSANSVSLDVSTISHSYLMAEAKHDGKKDMVGSGITCIAIESKHTSPHFTSAGSRLKNRGQCLTVQQKNLYHFFHLGQLRFSSIS
jgi:hypothetical protein